MKSNSLNYTRIGLLVSSIGCVTLACSAESSGTGPFDSGMSGATGAATGGTSSATSASSGGATTTATVNSGGTTLGSGGTATTSVGSTANTGGTQSLGGRSSSGGGTSAGGISASTGGTSAGGKASTGGTTASTGGKASTGGTTASTGGKASTGGTTASTGGKASTGGQAATGGTATGGSSSGTGGGTATGAKFSFFVISYRALQAKAANAQGFGGDLRYGTADGLTGADKVCTEVAEGSMPGNGKTWKAYLSTSTVNAIDRVGAGPWYDRLGRLVTASKAGLLNTRPQGADSAIINDLPNEDGVPNHAPDGSQVDNHDTLTGTNHLGTVYSATAHCTNWTSSTASTSAKPRVGHTWPRGNAGTGNTAGMAHWGSALDESGCGKGVNLVETGGPGNDGTVGSGGGYGGWYCFALTP